MNSKRVGEALRRRRGDRSMAEIAGCLGITVSALAMYERGERMPRDEIKERIAALYGCSVGSLFFSDAEVSDDRAKALPSAEVKAIAETAV